MADEPLGRMVIELGLDHSDFGKGLAGAKKETKYAMAEMKSSLAVVGQSGKQFDILAAKSKGLSQVMMSQERVVEKLGQAYKDSLVDGKASSSTAKLATQLQNANAKLASLRTQYINTAGAMAKARVETTGFTGGLNKLSKGAITTGAAMGQIGSGMTSKVSLPIAAGLAYATKSAVKFDSQIKSIGPLLTNGATVTAKYKAQLDQLGDASKEMSTKYGVSTTEINNGMTELIRRGYNTNQVLGSMPSIMDATMASGEDLGTVLNTTSSIVEQFGLKSKSTAGTLKNTQMVTDSITYAANATAAGFSDMGEAMSYVGPQAHAAGLSVQETAAAIGELSNKGIEGQKAGTNLRGILTSLVKVTPNASKAFSSMGISAGELKKDASDLPQLIDDITNGTKGWDKADKNKAIATAFGRENQSAMNALLETGSSKLRQLTKDTENSTGATKKQAEEMSNTSENNVKKLLASLQVLGIEVGAKLVPKLIPLVNKAKDLVEGFSDLDDSTQNTIIKFALLAAAAGPVLGMTGKLVGGFGKVGSTIVGTVAKFAEWKAKVAASKAVMNDVSAGADIAGKGIKGVGDNAKIAEGGLSIFGKSMTTAEAGAGILGTSLTATGAVVTGVGVAALAGVAYWELYGKQAHESAQRVDEWGSDIGKTASDAAEKMTGFETKASTALDGFNSNVKKNAKEVSKAFQDMVDSTSKAVDKQYKDAEKLAKQIGGDAGAALLKQAGKEKDANEKRIQDMQQTAKKVNEITSKAAKDGTKLTADQATTIANLQRKMAQDEIDTLKLKSSQKKSILAAELGETGSMTKKQLAQTAKDIGDAAYSEKEAWNKKYGQIEQARKDGQISSKEANVAEEQLTKTHNAAMLQLGEDLIRTEKEQGKSRKEIMDDLESNGFEPKEAKAAMKAYLKSLQETASTSIKITGDMSNAVKKAAEAWNDIVLDPKTGKLKTNAQEEVDKAVKDKDKWNSMLLLAKKGKMSSNAAAMVGIAALHVGKWDKLTLKEKQALIRSKGGDELAKLMTKGGEWGKLTTKEKEAIIKSKGGNELLQAMTKTKTWNKLSVKEKKAVIKDSASGPMKKAHMTLKDWNKLTPKMKTAIAKAKGTKDVAKGVKGVKDWNSLPKKVKELIAKDKGARKIISKVTSDYKKFGNLPKSTSKTLKASNKTAGGIKSAKNDISSFAKGAATKDIKASNKTQKGVSSSKKSVEDFTKKSAHKKILADNKTANGIKDAQQALDSMKDKYVHVYVKKVEQNALGSMGTSGGAIMVNDQKGPVFREAVKYPGRTPFIPHGRNVILDDAPKGTIVIPAGLTAQMYKVPQFATGTIPLDSSVMQATRAISDSVVHVSQTVNNTTQNTNGISGSQAQQLINQQGGQKDMTPLIAQLISVNNAILQAIKDQGTFDTKSFYKRQAKDLSISQFDGTM